MAAHGRVATMGGVFLALVVALLVVSCDVNNAVKHQTVRTETNTAWDGRLISGTTRNLQDSKISYIKLTFRLKDENHFPIGVPISVENKDGIAGNGSWDFKIPASAIGAVSAELDQTEAR